MFLTLIFSIASFAQTLPISSEGLKALIQAKNAKIRAQQSEIEAAQARTGHWGRSFLPKAELYGAGETFKSGSQASKTQPTYGAEVHVNLFNGLKDQKEESLRELEVDKRKIHGQKLLAEELQKARSSYWQILFLQEKQDLLKSAIEVNGQNLKAAGRRIKSGVATESDRVEFEMKEVELKREIAENGVALSILKRDLGLMVGLDAAQIQLAEKLGHDHDFAQFLKHTDKDHDFVYRDQEVQAEQLSLKAQQQKGMWLPKIDVFAGYNQYNEREKEFADPSDRTETVVGLRATIDLASGFDSVAEARSSMAEAQSTRVLAEHKKREVENHLEGEMAELKLLHDQVHAAEENIERAQKYYRLTQSEYGRGVKNSPDVLGASEKLFEMRHKRLEIVRDFQLAKAHVLSKIGR